jgi:hypothetical protein
VKDRGRSQNDHRDNCHSLGPPSDTSQKEQVKIYEQDNIWT